MTSFSEIAQLAIAKMDAMQAANRKLCLERIKQIAQIQVGLYRANHHEDRCIFAGIETSQLMQLLGGAQPETLRQEVCHAMNRAWSTLTGADESKLFPGCISIRYQRQEIVSPSEPTVYLS